jgi:hypothetical protein
VPMGTSSKRSMFVVSALVSLSEDQKRENYRALMLLCNNCSIIMVQEHAHERTRLLF